MRGALFFWERLFSHLRDQPSVTLPAFSATASKATLRLGTPHSPRLRGAPASFPWGSSPKIRAFSFLLSRPYLVRDDGLVQPRSPEWDASLPGAPPIQWHPLSCDLKARNFQVILNLSFSLHPQILPDFLTENWFCSILLKSKYTSLFRCLYDENDHHFVGAFSLKYLLRVDFVH